MYKAGDYSLALTTYQKALETDQKNAPALFNAGNASQKQQHYEDAAKYFQSVLKDASNPALQSKAGYNKGVAEIKQKQLQDAIQSFKQSLKLDPNDQDTRENLQKAINELKKQNEKNKDKKDDKQDKKDQQKKDEQQKQQPKNDMTKQQAENLLSQLRQEEKHLQDLQKLKIKQTNPEKDW